jgi:hypothetical protein
MITREEHLKLDDIKSRTLRKRHVTSAEKQWVLDLVAREQEPIRADVKQRAANSGFNVEGIVTL